MDLRKNILLFFLVLIKHTHEINARSAFDSFTFPKQISSFTITTSTEKSVSDKEEISVLPVFGNAVNGSIKIAQRFSPFNTETSIEESDEEQALLDKLYDRFIKGTYTFYVGKSFYVHNSSRANVPNEYEVNQLELEDYDDCLGFTTEVFETIVLQCTKRKVEEPGCYEVLISNPKDSNKVQYEKQEKTCVRKLNKACVGITTMDDTMIRLACTAPFTGYLFNVKNNTMPIPSSTPPTRFV